MQPISASFLILLLPLLAFVIQMFFGRRLPDHGWYVPTAAILAGLGLSLWIFFGHMLPANDPAWAVTLNWDFITIKDFHLPLGVRVDNITVIMLLVVTIVSGLVHIFSTGYMAEDPRKSRFFGYLGLFSFSMIWLVLSDNLLGIFIGWELVGLSSYLLIGFWFEKDGPPDASKKAFIANRVGDLGFLLALMILMWQFQTFNLEELRALVTQLNLAGISSDQSFWLTLAGIGLFCGAIGKSAQFPLHVWLPDAMEGPTPVSALIHAATMVAAGVYLMVRVFFILTFDASLVVAYIGGFTAFMAATIAIAQWDIKKVLAYSTISQLGYMIMAMGVGAYSAGFLHLMTHAFFKACLFLGSGSVIHAMHHMYHKIHDHSRDPQDMRNMGGLRKKMPITYITFLVATLALSGVPLTSGFISKDAILAGTMAFGMLHPSHWLLSFFGFAAAAMTAFYMFRLVFLTFHGEYKGAQDEAKHLHENKLNITGPLIVLASLSLFFFYTPNPTDAGEGWFFRLVPQPDQPLYSIGLPEAGTSHAESFSFVKSAHAEDHIEAHAEAVHDSGALDVDHALTQTHADEAHATGSTQGLHADDSHADHSGHDAHSEHIHHVAHTRAMIISILIVIFSITAAWLTYMKRVIKAEKVAAALPGLHRFLMNKWYFDELYEATVIRLTMVIARLCALFDQYIIDGLVDGAGRLTKRMGDLVGLFDKWVVDGAVNGAGWVTRTTGAGIRLLQTGDIQFYMVGALGAVILAFVIQVL
jgi:NADH-quinone oxidoreductase subunit L